MPSKKVVSVSIAQLTVQGSYHYPWVEMIRGEASFSPSFNTCYFQNKTFTKVKGGIGRGNYMCTETVEVYRISQH
jgi:hypothetical protein